MVFKETARTMNNGNDQVDTPSRGRNGNASYSGGGETEELEMEIRPLFDSDDDGIRQFDNRPSCSGTASGGSIGKDGEVLISLDRIKRDHYDKVRFVLEYFLDISVNGTF